MQIGTLKKMSSVFLIIHQLKSDYCANLFEHKTWLFSKVWSTQARIPYADLQQDEKIFSCSHNALQLVKVPSGRISEYIYFKNTQNSGGFSSFLKQNKTKQNKTKQNKTKQNKTKQNKTTKQKQKQKTQKKNTKKHTHTHKKIQYKTKTKYIQLNQIKYLCFPNCKGHTIWYPEGGIKDFFGEKKNPSPAGWRWCLKKERKKNH